MELVPAFAPRLDQAGGLEDVEVLRDRLPRRGEPVVGDQSGAELEECLSVAVGPDDPLIGVTGMLALLLGLVVGDVQPAWARLAASVLAALLVATPVVFALRRRGAAAV